MIYRADYSHVHEAWYEFVQGSISEREIPELKIFYYTDLADKHSDLISDNEYVRYGQEFFDGVQPTGLYAGKSKLKRLGVDANVAVWEQTFRVSTMLPEKLAQDPNPLNREVEFVERVSGFRKITTLIDYFNRPVMNRAGDRLSGFEIEIPTPTYRYRANFNTIPTWAIDYDGAVNTEDKMLPIRHRDIDGILTTVQNITLRAGTAKLRVTKLPFSPQWENGQQYFPVEWEYQESPIGWSEPQLNEGLREKVYLDAAGNLVDTAGIIAGNFTKTDLRHILDDKGEPVKEKVLLDWWGRRLKLPSLSQESQGTVTTRPFFISYDHTIGTAPITEEWIGECVKILPTGHDSRFTFVSVIDQVDTQAGTFSTQDPAPYQWTDAQIYRPGITALMFAAVPYADLSGVPVT